MPSPRSLLLVALVVLLAAAALAYRLGRDAPGAPLHGAVLRAVDGDTLLVRLDGGRRERVRLIGVDTPESVEPGTPPQCWSHRAATYTARVTRHRQVTLRVGREPRDRYGRLLAYVSVGPRGLDLQEALLRGGHARPLAIAPNVEHARAYARLAAEARRAHRGLWGACAPLGP
jgi:micrococcal nuclease